MKTIIQCIRYTKETDLDKLKELVLFYWEYRVENPHIELARA